MTATGNLEIELTDVLEHGLDDSVLIELFQTAASAHYRNREKVSGNKFAGKTHPYNVREILIAGQGVDPGYSFRFT